MDKQAYLNQISAAARPIAPRKPAFFSSLVFKIIVISVAAFAVISALGIFLGNLSTQEKNRAISLAVHLDNLSASIKTYQPLLKSSTLRSYSASLDSILSNTSRDLSAYNAEKYQVKDPKKLYPEETTLSEELNNELFKAKINGILDRTFAHKMSYEISMLTSRESELINSSRNSTLKALLSSSHTSLTNLYESFNNFSETK